VSTSELPAPVLLPAADEPVPVLLMNTLWANRVGTHDALTSAAELASWLDAVHPRLPGDTASRRSIRRRDVDEFRALRDALRRVAAQVTEDPRPVASAARDDLSLERAVDLVNRVSASAPSTPTLHVPEWELSLRPPAGARATQVAMSAVAGQAIGLFDRSSPTPLRACLAPGCVLYFAKDHPRREWCSDTCGNRARAARHYSRRHQRGVATDHRQ
jgi:predicted RNA-binding Zn ribbon-like protein